MDKIKDGMKGSNGGRNRTDYTEVLKKYSKKTRRVMGGNIIKEELKWFNSKTNK